jgi:hypothetical protein
LSFSETFDTPARRFLGTTPNQRFGVNGGDDSQIAPQAIEIAQNGLANDEPREGIGRLGTRSQERNPGYEKSCAKAHLSR